MKSLKVNDLVKVISGGFKGEEAEIVKIDREHGKAVLDGIGVRERHYAKSVYRPQGGKASVDTWIDLSNLKLVKAAETKKAAAKNTKAKKGAK